VSPVFSQKSISSFLYRAFRKDIGRKLMALLLALIMWIYVAQKVVDNKVHSLNIQVVTGMDAYIEESAKVGEGFFIILPETLMEWGGIGDSALLEEKTLEVTLSGPIERLPSKLVGKYEIITRTHMGDRDARTVTIDIIREFFKDLAGTRGVRVRFDPAKIEVRLAKRKEHKIRLTADNLTIAGELPPESEVSYDSSLVTFEPNPVVIVGPAPVIDRIEENPSLFRLEEVDIGSVRKDSSLDLRPSQEMRGDKISLRTRDNLVRVNLRLQDREEKVTLRGVPLTLLDSLKPLTDQERERLKPDQETVDLVLRGAPSAFPTLSAEQLVPRVMPVIDLQGGRETNTYEIVVWRLDLPEDIRISIEGESKMPVRYEETEPDPPQEN
jgi:hypothetical protein